MAVENKRAHKLASAKFIGSFAILWFLWCSYAFAGEANIFKEILGGARTAQYQFNEQPGPGCGFKTGLRQQFQNMINAITDLGLKEIPVEEINAIPDLTILVLAETREVEMSPDNPVCAMFIKVEALHTTFGRLRFNGENTILHSIAYRANWFGAAPKLHISDAVPETMRKALFTLGLNYSTARKSLN